MRANLSVENNISRYTSVVVDIAMMFAKLKNGSTCVVIVVSVLVVVTKNKRRQ